MVSYGFPQINMDYWINIFWVIHRLCCFFGVLFDPDTILMTIFDESFNASKEASKL